METIPRTRAAHYSHPVEVPSAAVSGVPRKDVPMQGYRRAPLADTLERVLEHSILVERDPEERPAVIPPSGWVHVGKDRLVVAHADVDDGSRERE
jgi:hypothetical protein